MSQLKADLLEIRNSLRTYLRHPVREIRRLPEWEWRRILIAQVLFTMTTGGLAGLVHHSFAGILFGFILSPILTLLSTLIITLFFFYVFQIFQSRFVDFRELYTAVLFANLPFFIFQIISDYFPPILLIGLGFSAILLIVAFVANFRVPRPFASKLIGGVYALLVALHIMAWVNNNHVTDHWQNHARGEDNAPEVELGK